LTKTTIVTKGADVHTLTIIKKLLGINDILVKGLRFEEMKGEEILVVEADVPKRDRNRVDKMGASLPHPGVCGTAKKDWAALRRHNRDGTQRAFKRKG
jgi:hypothetical protein